MDMHRIQTNTSMKFSLLAAGLVWAGVSKLPTVLLLINSLESKCDGRGAGRKDGEEEGEGGEEREGGERDRERKREKERERGREMLPLEFCLHSVQDISCITTHLINKHTHRQKKPLESHFPFKTDSLLQWGTRPTTDPRALTSIHVPTSQHAYRSALTDSKEAIRFKQSFPKLPAVSWMPSQATTSRSSSKPFMYQI